MTLAEHQRAMLHFMRTGSGPLPCDAYLLAVATSRDLQEARHNVFLWRSYVLMRTAPLTFNLLKNRGLLKAELDRYIARNNLSPFRETHAPVFLDQLSHHADPQVARVAQFEDALRLARQGDTRVRTLRWNCDPIPLLTRLAKDEPLDCIDENDGPYDMTIANDIPGFFDVRPATRRGSQAGFAASALR
jgi:hypothetical protein